MVYKIEEIEGIGQVYSEKLGAAGIRTTDDLLESCSNPKGRLETSTKTGLSEKVLLNWANMADLMRISGVGPEYSELLEAAGVDTVKELRTRNAANLAARIAEINTAKKLARRVPAASVVEIWIEEAKSMDPTITH